MKLGCETACRPDAGLNAICSYGAGYRRVMGQDLVGSCGRACDAVMRQHAGVLRQVNCSCRTILEDWMF